jgi:hypothetical protein
MLVNAAREVVRQQVHRSRSSTPTISIPPG